MDFNFGVPDTDGDIYATNAFGRKGKIKIAPSQPINTSVFEEATILEWNGVLTKEGMKEYRGGWVNEGEFKPIIEFLNR